MARPNIALQLTSDGLVVARFARDFIPLGRSQLNADVWPTDPEYKASAVQKVDDKVKGVR
jgi:hypothetical protein